MGTKNESKKLTKEEKCFRNELNNYIKTEILKYNNEKALPPYLWHRINAMRLGKTFHKGSLNNGTEYYTYEEILITFKYCKHMILRYLETNTFKDEKHKINAILLIVRNNINDVKDRIKRSEIQEERIRNDNIDNLVEDYTEKYTIKSKKSRNSLDKYW